MKNKLLLLSLGLIMTAQMIYSQVPSYVPTNGLVGYWPFNGNANDQSVNGLNGTVSGATLTNDRNGNANGAYLFNPSVASNISIQTQSVTGTALQNQFSIVMWVKANRVANYIGESTLCPGSVSVPMANSNQNWAFVPGNSGSNLGVGFSIGTNGVMVAEHANNILVSRLSNSSTYSSFVQVAIVYDSNNTYLYLNGALVRTRPMYCSSNIKMVPSLFTLGTSLYSPNFSGVIDDLGVWNRALTSSEIQSLFTGCSTSAPTGSTSQTLCSGSIVANLTATGTNIQWYASSTVGTALTSTTALVNGTTYYASQTVNGCESTTRLAVTVILNNPTVSASSSTVCSGQSTILTASSGVSTTSNFSVGSIGPSGGYVFYDQGSVINGWRYLEASPIDNGSDSGTGCYCVSIPNTSNAIGTGRTNTTNWISAGCNGGFIGTAITFNINGNTNWFVPSKDELNLMYSTLKLNNLGNFQNVQYWTSSPASYGSCGINGGAWVQNFTNGTQYSEARSGYQGAGNLRLVRQFSTGTPFSTYLWSTGATTASISVNPTTTNQYWVDVTTNEVTCRKYLTITVNSTTSAPTGSSSQTLCSDSTVSNLVATGTNIQWYSTSTGGTALASSTALVNGTTYYASQTVSGCESPTRLAVTITLNNPTVSASATTFCSGQSTILSVENSSSNGGRFFNLRGPSEPNQTVSISQWHNIVVTKQNLDGKVFIDGNLVINGQWANNQYNWTSLYLGANYYTGWDSFFKGWIDEVRISNIVRSDNEIINNYNLNTPFINDINTIGLWHFDESNGTNYINQSNGINGTLINGPTFQPGKFGNSLYFDGIDDRGDCDFNMPENNFTLELWVKIDGNIISGPSGRVVFIEPYGVYNSEMGFIPENNNSTFLWSTGATTASISVNPTSTTQYWVDVTTNGVTCRKYLTITVNSPPPPSGSFNQTMVQGSTTSNLVITGQNIQWYATPFGGTPLPANTPLVNGTTYYASQTINGCESQFRLPVIVQVTLSNEAFDTIKIVYNPNPVIDILNIKASVELKNVKICNLLGQTIFQQRFNSNEIQLNMSDFKTGTYFVIIESDDRKETFKILKK